MTDYRDYLNPQTLAELRGLHLSARLIVEGYLAGLHRSPHQGYSVEFAQHREYVAGDDLRYVDWKVFGRTDRYYLKQYEEETNFDCWLLLDASESMNYRSPGAERSKFECARLLAAALGYLAIHQQDTAGLAVFNDEVRDFVRAAGAATHLKQLIDVMDRADCRGQTSLGPMLHDLSRRIRKRGLVILLSDLFDDPASLHIGLKRLRHRRHDVRVVQVLDPAELDFPFEEPTLFHGLEGLPDQMVEPRSLRDAYLKEFHQFLYEVRRMCRELGFTHTLVRSDQPLESSLRALLTGEEANPLPQRDAAAGA